MPVPHLPPAINYLRAGSLIVDPHELVDRLLHIGYEDSILVLLGSEQLILHDLLRFLLIGVILVTQGNESISLAPSFRLVPKLTLGLGIGMRRRFPVGSDQFFQQTRSLARYHDKL